MLTSKPLARAFARIPAAGLCLAAAVVCAPALALAQGLEQVEIDRTGPAATKLGIILVVFLVILFTMRNVRVPQMLRAAAIWIAALLGLVALYAYRAPLETMGREMVSVLMPGSAVQSGDNVIVRRNWSRQFMLDASVDGTPVDFVFDTGASLVVLAAADAERAGFDPARLAYRIPVMTAAGMTEVAPVQIGEITIADITVRDVRAAVAKPGDLETSLLGMTFLDRLEGYEVRRDRLVLIP